MKYVASNNGTSLRAVASDYAAQNGEAVFDGLPTSDQLASAFSGYAELVSSAQIKAEAQAALIASDLTILRCVGAGVEVPEEWSSYRATLRAIKSSGVGPLPNVPTYPPNT